MLDALLFVRCGAAICLAFGCKQPRFRVSELSLRSGATALLAWHDLPFHKLEKQQIFRFTSVSRLFGRGIVLVSTGRETCLFTPRGEKFVPGRLSSAASIPPTPCELSTATAVEPAAWSSRRQQTIDSL